MTPTPTPSLVSITVRPGRQFVYQGATYHGLDTVTVDPSDPDVIEADRQQWINPTAHTYIIESAP